MPGEPVPSSRHRGSRHSAGAARRVGRPHGRVRYRRHKVRDPEGYTFEVMWEVPRSAWGEFEKKGGAMPLDLDAAVTQWGRSAR